jgi:hypothetical protein
MHSDHFKPALRDGSDPLYAPRLTTTKGYCYWIVPRWVPENFTPRRVKLPGKLGDGNDLERAAMCRALTIDMLDRVSGVGLHPEGSWALLVHRFLHDRISPIHAVKFNTREAYVWQGERWAAILEGISVADTSYELLQEIIVGMREKGRSDDFIRRLFRTLGTITTYGQAIRFPGSDMVRLALGPIRLPAPPKREVAPTQEQIRAVIDEADARGMHDFALTLLLMWEFALRRVDVIGLWERVGADATGIIRVTYPKRRKGKETAYQRWSDGLTWDMIDTDITQITKVISKTRKAMPWATRFPIINPEIRTRLRLLGSIGRVGPVIRSTDGLPYTDEGMAKIFRRICDHLGLPAELRMMDTRAGAITEAKNMGASPMDLRDAAVHTTVNTTSGYARERDSGVSNVVRLRAGARNVL